MKRTIQPAIEAEVEALDASRVAVTVSCTSCTGERREYRRELVGADTAIKCAACHAVVHILPLLPPIEEPASE
jgi:glutamate racemase